MKARSISEIAAEIRADWGGKVSGAAAPYLAAMEKLSSIHDEYGHGETALEIVVRFLSVANTWRGETARRIKSELNTILDGQGVN